MIDFTERSFVDLFDRGDAVRIEGVRFVDCVFENSALSLTKDVQRRSTVSDVELIRCSANGCDVGPAVLSNVVVDSLTTDDLLIVWGALFDRVVFRGLTGKIKINRAVHHVDRSPAIQGPFDLERERFYQRVEWALDISQARFKEFDIRGVPSRLIRRDPESQVIVTRERALVPGWRDELSASNRLWPFMIDLFLTDGDPDVVLVAPLGAPKAKREALLAGLNELRRLGVAEPS